MKELATGIITVAVVIAIYAVIAAQWRECSAKHGAFVPTIAWYACVGTK